MLTLDDFDFDLPSALIAQHPTAERTASRLLQVTDQALHDHRFGDLPELIAAGDLLVFNDTRVIRARLFGRKESGGRIEVLIERISDARHALAQIRASKSPKPGSRILLEDAITLIVRERSGEQGEFFALELAGEGDLWALIEKHGRLPLPPYITHAAGSDDEKRYQTVFARHPGAVAAPTAGLHFDDALLAQLGERGIEAAWLTLHVGAGTFQPVRVHSVAEHRMHAERFEIPPATIAAIARTHARGGQVIAVGTTSLRALEAAAQGGELHAGPAETDIFITPGYPFRVVDRLITNFHLPKSTLLMLVSAFAGMDAIRSAYRHAISHGYRFFSYGDAMFLDRRESPRAALSDLSNTCQ
ncbi:S-adenosylmethionine:tRNA ribosyltransferase-isomerase [Candidatus Accumulibacter aalborgensis]|uniref:S-adenosylmethionine:tRNA ribosyltransferase-isomerase n=1 Tax=Candidatus Accumulibacter aalborgensis TaxID=1860102 RepID=A0A1A8XZ57_9PROT|nr:tRNA preQ1(34) S-adenosylmethionine ribosyltransferase-isomerase QueA [Candidatus Accumulibacter aalborgensis]SBT09952.1 S-adenosylmethionine:tRNA ribosyltransferase-isomerase [Candidatus Accumulibacter aalborgensis]